MNDSVADPNATIRAAWNVVRQFRVGTTDIQVFDAVGPLVNIRQQSKPFTSSYGGKTYTAVGNYDIWDFELGFRDIVSMVPGHAQKLAVGDNYLVLFCGKATDESGVPQSVIHRSTKSLHRVNDLDVLAKKINLPVPAPSNGVWFVIALLAMASCISAGWYAYVLLAAGWVALTAYNLRKRSFLLGRLREGLEACENFWRE